jgi:hypothetical protein
MVVPAKKMRRLLAKKPQKGKLIEIFAEIDK